MLRRVIVVLMLLMLSTIPLASATTEMLLQSEKNTVSIGEEFTCDVVVKPDQEMDTVSIDLMTWNSNVLEFVNMSQGDVFENSLVWIQGTAGEGNYTWLCWGCNVPTSSEGRLVRFTFRGIANGTSEISLDKAGVAREGNALALVTGNMSVVVGSGTYVNPMSELPNIPIFFIFAVILIIVAVVVSILMRKSRKKVESPNDPNHPDK